MVTLFQHISCMKKLIFISFVFFTLSVKAQHSIPLTDEIVITGVVEKELIVRSSDLQSYPVHDLKNVRIVNHKGQKKGVLKKLKGVRILDILKNVQMANSDPKSLSEFFFIFVASDGYKVVYSWNELFNTETGKNTFILLHKDGVQLADMTDRLILLTPSDKITGRRYVKGLSRIVISKV